MLAFKKKRDIINRSYQQQADDIVGIMTMAELDREMRAIEQSSTMRGEGCRAASDDPEAARAAAVSPTARLERVPTPWVRAAQETGELTVVPTTAFSRPRPGATRYLPARSTSSTASPHLIGLGCALGRTLFAAEA